MFDILLHVTLDLSVSIIDADHELDRIIKSTNLDEYECIDLPLMQPGDSSHEHTDVGLAPDLDTESTLGRAPRKGRSTELRSRVSGVGSTQELGRLN